uniref:N-acetylneuraminic acid phosphatase n=1 Tax=Oryzias sinensis TaxID=183150 RepID=A0A8C7ZAH7_9TELE
MAGQTVGAILFDLDNTLIETTKAGGVAIQKTSELLRTALGIDDATISSICNKFKQKLLQENFDPLSGRSLDDTRVRHWEESIEETLGSLPRCSLGAECYYLWKKSRLDALSLSPEVRDLLRRLRCRYKLLLLTNGEARSQQEKVDAVQCQEFFDAIVIGGEHAEQKPSVSIFTLCFNRLGVEARECVMVGDSLDTDIQGGLNAGVRATVWVNSGESAAALDGSVRPHFTVSSVLDLPHVLDQLE